MGRPKFVLDTNAVIFLLKSETVPETLNDADLFISIISRIELLSKPDITPNDIQEIKDFLIDVTAVDINDSIENETIELRRSTKIKLPDCIIAATSIILNAILLTDDDRLLHLTRPNYTVQTVQ
jgi:predicted nucleic acid-binding protein